MPKGVQQKIKQRIETIEGLPICESLINAYFTNMLTSRKICAKWNINNRTLMRLFRDYGLKFRQGGEAIKTQWIDATERKIKTSERLAEMRKTINPALGCSRTDAAKRMRESNPMFDVDVRKKANKKTAETYKANPERYAQFHKPLTECEQIVFDYFIKIGIKAIGNEHINGRIVDIFLPDFNTIIECVNHSRFPLSFDRHKQIQNDCNSVVYCTNRFIKNSNLNILHQYIHRLDVFSTLPAFHSQKTMVFGRRNGVVFDIDLQHFTAETINVDSDNLLFLTAATNNKI